MNIGEQLIQGDVLLTRIDQLPKNLIPKNSNIVLEGEATGHHHRVTSGQILINPKKKNPLEIGFIKSELHTELVHEEHPTIRLGKGLFIVTRQREAVNNVQGFRSVLD